MIEVDFIVEKCEMRSDIHEITAETEKPFQDHFWKDHFCDSWDCFCRSPFSSAFSAGWEIIFILFILLMYW